MTELAFIIRNIAALLLVLAVLVLTLAPAADAPLALEDEATDVVVLWPGSLATAPAPAELELKPENIA